jgi:hypothetical protein
MGYGRRYWPSAGSVVALGLCPLLMHSGSLCHRRPAGPAGEPCLAQRCPAPAEFARPPAIVRRGVWCAGASPLIFADRPAARRFHSVRESETSIYHFDVCLDPCFFPFRTSMFLWLLCLYLLELQWLSLSLALSLSPFLHFSTNKEKAGGKVLYSSCLSWLSSFLASFVPRCVYS